MKNKLSTFNKVKAVIKCRTELVRAPDDFLILLIDECNRILKKRKERKDIKSIKRRKYANKE